MKNYDNFEKHFYNNNNFIKNANYNDINKLITKTENIVEYVENLVENYYTSFVNISVNDYPNKYAIFTLLINMCKRRIKFSKKTINIILDKSNIYYILDNTIRIVGGEEYNPIFDLYMRVSEDDLRVWILALRKIFKYKFKENTYPIAYNDWVNMSVKEKYNIPLYGWISRHIIKICNQNNTKTSITIDDILITNSQGQRTHILKPVFIKEEKYKNLNWKSVFKFIFKQSYTTIDHLSLEDIIVFEDSIEFIEIYNFTKLNPEIAKHIFNNLIKKIKDNSIYIYSHEDKENNNIIELTKILIKLLCDSNIEEEIRTLTKYKSYNKYLLDYIYEKEKITNKIACEAALIMNRYIGYDLSSKIINQNFMKTLTLKQYLIEII